MSYNDTLDTLAQQLADGRLGRRGFIKRAAALGLSTAVIAGVLAACGATDVPAVATTVASTAPTVAAIATAVASTAPTVAAGGAATAAPATAAATRATAAATPGAASASPSVAAGPTKRGGGGPLKLLWWQSPTVLNPHLASGQKDTDASRPVYEPLATIDIDGNYVPILGAEIPSKENGGLSVDGTSVTWKLKKGVKWSDGQPFTAKDIVFTWQYVTNKETAATTIGTYKAIKMVEAIDDNTVKITFTAPTAGWFEPFVNQNGLILPEHVFTAGIGAPAKNFPANLAPIGTGPYKVTNFAPGDTVLYAINENYREANKPSFDTVQFKGGGDAASAARAVLQSGDYDYAWNLQVEDTVLKQLETGGKGTVVSFLGSSTERLLVNFTDPNKEDPATGERSSTKFPHPFQTDKAVRNAYALACDRKTIVDALYGRAGSVGENLLYNPPQYSSKSNPAVFDMAKANALLDQAGYAKSGQYRAKNGIQLKVLYQTTVNPVRQKTQQIIKDAWEKLGVQTELKSIDAGVYFSSDPGNPDTSSHFYADIEMYTNGNSSPEPFAYMEGLTTSQIAQKSNQWSGNNNPRWSNKDYDAVIDQLKNELDPDKRTALLIKANDIEVQDYAEIPLVARRTVYGKIKGLQNQNSTTWDSELWNIANWVKS